MKSACLAVLAVVLASCGAGRAGVAPASSPATTQIPAPGSPSPAAPAIAPGPAHVFVIVMENRSFAQVAGSGYVARLASEYGVATNYHGVSHPSLPNYLAMTSGSTWGIADDGYHSLPAGGLGGQLTAAGIEWRAYMEGMANGCFHSSYPYALKHDPFAYYGGGCPQEVVPFGRFGADMSSGDVPRFVWITPGLCHDGHDCSNAVADAWLAQTVPAILATPAWQDGGVLFITWDEGEDSANSVMTLVIRSGPLLHRSARAYDHYSLLASIEDLLGVARLGQAAHAAPMSDLLAAVPPPPGLSRMP